MGVVSGRGSSGRIERCDGWIETNGDGTVEDFVENKEDEREGEGGDCFSMVEGWIRSSFGEGRCRRNR